MKLTIPISVHNQKYSAELSSGESTWGKWVIARIIGDDGNHVGTIKYGCHPEFDEFEKYQTMSETGLMLEAIERVNVDIQGELFIKACELGTTLLLRFNS